MIFSTGKGSFDKIAARYFSAITKQTFTYRGVTFEPKRELVVSPLLFRDYTCPAGCGACCYKMGLDWLPTDPQPPGLPQREVEFNGKKYILHSDTQENHSGAYCRNLSLEDGRCGLHLDGTKPFHCDAEMVKFIHKVNQATLMSKLYGRGWALTQVTGKKGAMCEMLPADEKSVAEVVRKLKRLKEWVDYFELESWSDDLIRWAENYADAPTHALRLTMGEGRDLAAPPPERVKLARRRPTAG